MNIRRSCLSAGWYPRRPEKIAAFLEALPPPAFPPGPVCKIALAPHAGWYYSGVLAAASVSALAGRAAGNSPGSREGWDGTVAVIGGHLPAGAPPLFAMEDGADTPLGPLEMDSGLRDLLLRELGGGADRYADNTVEVLLPMVKYFFPRARLLWLRLPAETASYEAGRVLARSALSLGREIRVLGSTDLTHYGYNYGFTPRGSGRRALDWVKTVNDRRFIEAVLEGDGGAVLARAEEEKSACSAGAALGCLGFAAETAASGGGAESALSPARPPSAELLAYGTSADTAGEGEIPDSFVGYAALRWV